MKTTTSLSAAAALLLAGCIYEAPLVAEHTLAIDPAVVGLWEALPEEGNGPDANKQLLILKFSDTEYLVRCPMDKAGIHCRAYPVELGGKKCVQLQVIGTGEDPPDWGDETPKPFLVVSFGMKDGKLLVHTLDKELVSEELKTTAALQEAFLKNKDNPELFGEPTVYRKVRAE